MASTGKCSYCGSTISSEDQKCPYCGAPNPNYVPDMERTVFLPKTIEELKEYCAERGMPLLRMRFFIGEDFREPRAFGIYRENDDTFVVYKNKADGSRAVRYRGPDEAHAVNELFLKLLDECHKRGIYPDGKTGSDATRTAGNQQGKPRKGAKILLSILMFLVIYSAFIAVFALAGRQIYKCSHRNDGSYQYSSDTVYYHHGNDWYYTTTDTDSGYWYEGSFPASDYENYLIGTDYDSDWGVSDFQNSSTYESLTRDKSSSSSDYSDWDSSDTDWSSDW